MGKTCFFILVEMAFLCHFVVEISNAATNLATDQSALLALKAHITQDPHNILSSNWSASTSVCDWACVRCGRRHQRVTTLNLSMMNLTGTIPPQLGNLSFLTYLDISNNSFYGNLPKEFANLRRLRKLHFENNNFNVEIPSWVGFLSKLLYLNLEQNSFIGTIPPSICNISSLQVINLSANQLWGSIPSPIFNMSSLRFLLLKNNRFTGPLPTIYKTSQLRTIEITKNNLSGDLPEMFRYLPQLEMFHLSYNNFEGRIPLSLFTCKRLQSLSLSINNFARESIPREIGNLTSLRKLYLGLNNFIGEIPGEISNLRSLNILSLAVNSLTGPIPIEIFNISTLTMISLAHNDLSGSLPSTMGLFLPNLQELYLGVNRFTGHIPSFISNASMLTTLDIYNNQFFGLIPNTLSNLRHLQVLSLGKNNLITDSSSSELSFLNLLTNCRDLKRLALNDVRVNGVLSSSIGNLSTSLEILSLTNCSIKGTIPPEIGNIRSLVILDLRKNELKGSIPNTIGRLQNLQDLILFNNNLEGVIPNDLCRLKRLNRFHSFGNKLNGSLPGCLGDLISLKELSLASNHLTSTIPSTLWTLRYILKLDLSSNSLTGSLPANIGHLDAVLRIDLSSNQLSGDIPSTIGNLKTLQWLYLEDNSFQGQIPKTFGALTSIESLDMSGNNLSGEIPHSLEALLFLKYLNLSFNALEGEVPKEGPFAKLSAQSFSGNKALCGAPRLQLPLCKSRTPPKTWKTSKVLLIYVLPIIALMVLVLSFVLMLIRCHKRDRRPPTDAEIRPREIWRRISYHQLLRATDRFSESNLLGKGSFGSVYKGTLEDGKQIAVKAFHLQVERASRSFEAECEALRNIRHRNLVKIISACSNEDFKALVLDYMPNGTLEKWLHDDNYSLDISQRLNVVIDVASALEYLHHNYITSIVHCDLKPSNVLLDESMVAHLSDFGISKLLGEEASMTHTKTLATIDYMAPEYGGEGMISIKGDVYSYGIMLMETFTRKKPTDKMFSGKTSLKRWVSDAIQNSSIQVIDPDLIRMEDRHFAAKEQCVSSVLSLTMECTRELPENRISMKDVLTRLSKIRKTMLANIQSHCE